MIKRTHDRDGITLVEGVIALFLMALALTGACRLIAASYETSDRARRRYAAANIAKNRLERVLAINYHAVEFCRMQNVVVDRNCTPDPDGAYRLSTTVSPVNSSLKKITVRVDIRNRHSLAFDGETHALSSYVSNFAKLPDSV